VAILLSSGLEAGIGHTEWTRLSTPAPGHPTRSGLIRLTTSSIDWTASQRSNDRWAFSKNAGVYQGNLASRKGASDPAGNPSSMSNPKTEETPGVLLIASNQVLNPIRVHIRTSPNSQYRDNPRFDPEWPMKVAQASSL